MTLPTGKKKESEGRQQVLAEGIGRRLVCRAAKSRTVVPPIISEFAGTYGGKPFNVRVVHSVRRKIEGKFEGAADDTEELLETVSETAEALAAAIVQ